MHTTSFHSSPKMSARRSLRPGILSAVEFQGSPRRAHLFGSTAAASHYNCFAKIIAFLARRIPKGSRVGYLDDFGAMASLIIVGGALAFSAELNRRPAARLRRFLPDANFGARLPKINRRPAFRLIRPISGPFLPDAGLRRFRGRRHY